MASPADFQILDSKRIEASLTFQGQTSRDHSIPHRPFPIGGSLDDWKHASISNGFRDIQ